MKIRITALICVTVMVMTLLPGCGAAEPEATTVATTEVPTVEPTTEPTEEVTTIPTEPPTAFEVMDVELWEHATEIIPDIAGWNRFGVDMPISRGVCGNYVGFQVGGYDEVSGIIELVDDSMQIEIYEFPASSFDDEIDWMEEALTPFYEFYKEQESNALSYNEWINANQDKKLIYLENWHDINLEKIKEKAIAEGHKKLTMTINWRLTGIVNRITGEVFVISGEHYDGSNLTVGSCMMGQRGEEVEICALHKWSVQWYHRPTIRSTIEENLYLLVPADFEDICFVIPEYASVEAYQEAQSEVSESDELWETANILEDSNTERYNYHFIGFELDS